MEKLRFASRCVHEGGRSEGEHPFGALSVPIFQTATFTHPGIGLSTGYDYSRQSNPTRTALERQMADLEEAVDAIACSSGMAAIALAFDLLSPGSHVICTEDLYGGTVRILAELAASKNLSVTYVDTSDAGQVAAAIRRETAAIYVETPSNPTMQVTDIRAIKKLIGDREILLMVDNTFLSPFFQKPISLGADIVLHSGTKYLSGHNDVLAGFICLASQELSEKVRFHYKTVGCSLSPFDSFLMLRGIKTLCIRLERQQENAIQIAEWLASHKKVRQVYYVGLPSHPGYDINRRQATGSGSMISFRVDSARTAKRALERIRLISYAESLGGVESLLTYPMLQTHGDVPLETRRRLGITDEFLRLSVGIEDAYDLIADLESALQ